MPDSAAIIWAERIPVASSSLPGEGELRLGPIACLLDPPIWTFWWD